MTSRTYRTFICTTHHSASEFTKECIANNIPFRYDGYIEGMHNFMYCVSINYPNPIPKSLD